MLQNNGFKNTNFTNHDLMNLIDQLKQRDQQGMAKLMQYYTPFVRYIIAPILPDPQEQEECLSDVFMRVWEKIELYDAQRGSWNGWLSVLARNTALNRARKKPPPMDSDEASAQLPSPEIGPEERVIRQELLEALQKAMSSFSTADRALFYRKYYYMQSTAQIASELDVTPRAVEGRLYRLKKRLRKRLGGEGFEWS